MVITIITATIKMRSKKATQLIRMEMLGSKVTPTHSRATLTVR